MAFHIWENPVCFRRQVWCRESRCDSGVVLHQAQRSLFLKGSDKTFQHGWIMTGDISGIHNKFSSMQPVQNLRCVDYGERGNFSVCPAKSGNTTDLFKVWCKICNCNHGVPSFLKQLDVIISAAILLSNVQFFEFKWKKCALWPGLCKKIMIIYRRIYEFAEKSWD